MSVVRTMLMKNMEDRIPFVLQMLYPTAYLEEKIPNDPNGRTYRAKQIEVGQLCAMRSCRA